MSTSEHILQIIGVTLQLGNRIESFTESTPLLGAIPELDSMAVVTLVTSIEDHFGIVIDDDEITADEFTTVGSLCAFVDQKLAS
jgi:acyl carrier protein